MQSSVTPVVAAAVVDPTAYATATHTVDYARPGDGTFAAVVPAGTEVAQMPRLLQFERSDIKAMSGRGMLTYRAVVGTVPVIVASVLVACFFAAEITLMYFTIQKATTPFDPQAQSALYTNNSWCFIEPLPTPGDDNPCVVPSLRAALMTPSDYYNGESCEAQSDEAYAFCNTDPNITIEWCKEMFDIIVNIYACNEPEYTFSTPSNYSTVGYAFVHDDLGFFYSMWGYLSAVHLWGIIAIGYLAKLPRNLVRTEDAFILSRRCCCVSRAPLKSVRMLCAAESFQGFYPAQYNGQGRRRAPATNCCTVGVGTPTVWFFHGRRITVAASLSRQDFDRFLAENIQFGAPSSDVESNVAVAVPAHRPEPVKPQST